MKISVIIPTYNREDFILDAIKSVQNQTYKPDQIIVVDDGSTDNTKKIVQNIDGVEYIYQNNQGVSSARNKGIEYSRYRWIAFLDSDDIWYPTKLEKQIDFHIKNKDILFSHTQEVWKRGDKIIKQKKSFKKPSGNCFLQNISTCIIGPSTVMINKDIFDDVGYFDESLEVCEDYDIWLRVLRKYSLGLIDEPLIEKRAGHSGQLSFGIKFHDKYKIIALQKHINSRYKDEVIKEIVKKCDILIKGGEKHNNHEVKKYYSSIKKLSMDKV